MLIVLIIRSLVQSFSPYNKNLKNNSNDSSDDIIDVDYEEVD